MAIIISSIDKRYGFLMTIVAIAASLHTTISSANEILVSYSATGKSVVEAESLSQLGLAKALEVRVNESTIVTQKAGSETSRVRSDEDQSVKKKSYSGWSFESVGVLSTDLKLHLVKTSCEKEDKLYSCTSYLDIDSVVVAKKKAKLSLQKYLEFRDSFQSQTTLDDQIVCAQYVIHYLEEYSELSSILLAFDQGFVYQSVSKNLSHWVRRHRRLNEEGRRRLREARGE